MQASNSQSSVCSTKKTCCSDFSGLNESMVNYNKEWEHGNRQELYDSFTECENNYLLNIASGKMVENYYGLFSVFGNTNLFTNVKIHENEAKRRLLFTKKYNPKTNCINTKNEFDRYFDIATDNMFLCMDWNNVLIAGGSILSLLSSVPDEYKKSDETLKKWFSKEAKFGDIDIFLYGLSDRQATKKIFEIYESIKKVVPSDILCIRGPRALTFVIGNKHRHVQIVLRNFKTVAEILLSFDIDSCCFGYDGNKVWCCPRSHHAITHSVNTVVISKSSASFEYRLSKYGKRGYAVYVPNFTEENLNEQIYTRPPHQLDGLAKLLVLEKLDDNVKYQMYRDVLDLHQVSMKRNLSFKSTYEESDYNKIYLPEWNETYTINDVKTMMANKHTELNKTNGSKPKYYCFVGNLNDVIVGKNFDYECDSKTFVNGRLKWHCITDSDFVQLGVFISACKKITDSDLFKWYQSAYYEVSGNKNQLMDCVIGLTDQEELLNILKEGKNGRTEEEYNIWKSKLINSRDIANRVPLHQAIIRQDAGVVALLLEHGADVFYVSKLGKTALHTAAEVGNVDIMKALINHVSDKTSIHPQDSYRLTPILYSLMYGNVNVFKYLYKLDSTDNEELVWTFKYDDKKSYRALKMCLLFRQYQIAKFLLKNEYDVNDYYKVGQQYKHILEDSVESNDYEMFNLLMNYIENDMNDQTLKYELSDLHNFSNLLQEKYNKSKTDDDLEYYEKFITRLYEVHTNKNALYTLLLDMLRYHRFDRFKTYVKENSVNISLVCEGKSLLDETETRIKWIKQEIDTFKKSIKSIPTTQSDQTVNYKYESGTIDVVDGEVFVIPQWIIKNEIKSIVQTVEKVNQEQKIIIDTKQFTKEQIEKKIEYANTNLEYYEKVKKYLEGKGVISMIGTTKLKTMIKSEPKTFKYLYQQKSNTITKSVKVCVMSGNTAVDDQQTYLELLNDISKGNDLSEYDLDKFDLNCYLASSLMTPLKLTLSNNQYGTFLILLKHMVTHKVPTVETKTKIIRNNLKLKNALSAPAMNKSIGKKYSDNEDDSDEDELDIKPVKKSINSVVGSVKLDDVYYYNFNDDAIMSLIKSLSKDSNECGLRYLVNGLVECGVGLDVFVKNVWKILETFATDGSFNLTTELLNIFEERKLQINTGSEMIVRHIYQYDEFEGIEIFLRSIKKYNKINDDILVQFLMKVNDRLHYKLFEKSTKVKMADSTRLKIVINVIKLLLELNPSLLNTKYNGEYPITLACKSKINGIINTILEFNPDMNVYDSLGYYPIHIVSEAGVYDNIETILEKHPDEINRQSNEQLKTPLMLVSKLCYPTITELLMKYNPNQTLRDVFGNTVLHWAMIKSNINMISKLTLHNSENYLRMTPIDYVINGMKCYFHHTRNKKLQNQFDSTKLPFIMQIYKKYASDCLEMDREIAPYKQIINTNKYILNSIEDGVNHIPEKLKI